MTATREGEMTATREGELRVAERWIEGGEQKNMREIQSALPPKGRVREKLVQGGGSRAILSLSEKSVQRIG